jgi:adenylylsulfate kinase
MAEPKAQNITWHGGHLGRSEREQLHGHRGATLWFTGLSGSGKSTVARRVEQLLSERRHHVYTLDGDNVRYGLCSDLGFSPEDRTENIRRIGEVCKLFTDAGLLTLAAFVSPYRADRSRVREILGRDDFIEVYVAADLSVCESRDPKGLYKKARAGQIADFTGISAPYEAPEAPEITLRTDHDDVDTCAQKVVAFLLQRAVIPDLSLLSPS